MVYHTIFIKTFFVFCLFNLTLLLLTKDPAMEGNPGPVGHKKITYTSDKEKKLFQCLNLLIMTLPIFQLINNLWLTVKK